MNVHKHYISPNWPAPANIHAATTMRTGGQSLGKYSSLNPAHHVHDNTNSVIQNRETIKAMLKLPADPVWLEQVHSNLVINAASSTLLPKADASYSLEPNVVCAVLTADCLPLLICTANGSQVAAIHAGWRGLLSGIITNTLSLFQQTDVLVWLGPAIGAECFETGAEVRNAFSEKSFAFNKAFKYISNGKYLADIYHLARIELESSGINKIYGGGFCTVCESERFYSYRRDKDTGRMVTLIWRE